MESQHTRAPQEGAPTESVLPRQYTRRELFRAELNRFVASGLVMSHANNSLKALRAAFHHLSRCPEHEFKTGLSPERALANRATLELIRLELNDVERQILRAEVVHAEHQRAQREAEQLRQREEESA